MKRILVATFSIAFCSGFVFGQTESRAETLKQIESKRAELAILEKRHLAPADEDCAQYAEFLSQADTGLIRLLPRESFDREDKMTIRGGGAYYSFVLLTHAYGRGSDIELQQNRLSVGFAGYDYGLLVRAGDGPLDELNFEHPSVQTLANYRIGATDAEARSEHRRIGSGANVDGVEIRSHLPVELNGNYVLRSINYDDSDVLVAVKLIRKDQDGSVTLLWKILKRFPKPEIVRTGQIAN
ncbi:MAG: hypothetical protein ACXW3C_00060 [Pyrinomonadaceae bacterium]